jgi:hypothetical protein
VKAQAFWVTAPGAGELRTETLADPGADQLLVQTLFSGVSRGTESLVFRGAVPVSQHDRMRCPHQVGSFDGPVKYGYINVGRVERGSGLEGRNVFCLFPHQDRYVVNRSDVTVLPEGMDPSIAVLAANMETAVNGVWDARPLRTDRVTVIGAGVVGALVAWRLQFEVDAPVELVDTRSDREALARALGMTFSLPHDAQADRTLIVHASGSEAGLRQALELAADDGRIVEMSWYGDRDVSLPLGEAFHSRRLTIQSSQVGAIPPHLRGEFSFADRMKVVLAALQKHPELQVLINSESSFAELPETMARLAGGASEVLCHRVRYEEN